MKSLYGREESEGSPLRTLVPTRANWKADRGIPLRGVFQFTSTETRTLLDALDFHHCGAPSLTAKAPAADVTLPSPIPVPLTAPLRAALKAYLEAAPDTARCDALLHGIKQLTLPGEDPEVVDASATEA